MTTGFKTTDSDLASHGTYVCVTGIYNATFSVRMFPAPDRLARMPDDWDEIPTGPADAWHTRVYDHRHAGLEKCTCVVIGACGPDEYARLAIA